MAPLDSAAYFDLHEQIALGLLYPCWRGVADGYKQKYARSIWQQFEDNIRSAAYTSSLPRFLDVLCRKLGIELRGADTPAVHTTMSALDARIALKVLRDETTLLVLLVRVHNDERKEQRRQEREEETGMKDGTDPLMASGGLFGGAE